jgi:hypothetical protein
VGGVGLIAAEELVAALAREHHLDVAGGQPGDQVGGHRGGVGEGLVEGARELRQELRHLRRDHEFVVIGVVAPRDLSRQIELVERALPEADRKGGDAL